MSNRLRWILLSVGVLVVLAAAVDYARARAEAQREHRQNAAIAEKIRDLFFLSGGKKENLTPQQRALVDEFTTTGTLSPEAVARLHATLRDFKPAESSRKDPRIDELKRIWDRTGGDRSKMTFEDQQFLRKIMGPKAMQPD